MTNQAWTPEDVPYMEAALEEAKAAPQHHDVPVGAVLVDNATGEVIARAHNTREQEGSALGHAEIATIQKACNDKGNWRLSDCTLYVTLEPCPMCAGAILAARIPRVVCGAKDPVAGAMGSVWALHEHPLEADRHVNVVYGCREQESRELLREFFKSKR